MANQNLKLKSENSRLRSGAASARAWGRTQVATTKKWAAVRMREERNVRNMDTGLGIAGAHATAVVQGQIHRELMKRDKLWLARLIGYGAGIGGALLAVATKGKSRAATSGGLALTGMSIAQLAIDTHTIDLVPGMNG